LTEFLLLARFFGFHLLKPTLANRLEGSLKNG
jgi:hypothetical protein